MTPSRSCKTCGESKPHSEFPLGPTYRGGIRPNCVPCHRAIQLASHHRSKHKHEYVYERDRDIKLRKAYGIGYQEYLTMLDSQGGCCAICGTNSTGKRKAFHVDHCHKTSLVRGLLCGNCNSGIGNLRDDVNLLQRAIKYLQSSEE